MTALALVLGLAIGVVVGAVGGGGAILALPVLVYVLDEPVGPAATASLVVVTVAAAIGAGSLARRDRVCRRLAVTFAAPAAAGSLLGTLASRQVGGETLILAFVPVMFVAAAMTWRRAGEEDTTGDCPRPPLVRVLIAGLLVGVLTGFFGVGGGFLIVPVLTVWLATPFRRAVGTSLVIIGLTGLAALTSHLVAGARPDVAITVALATATGAGALLGSLIAHRAPTAILGRAFAALIATIALALAVDVLFLGGPPA